jgi:hypothetical protein
MTKKKIKAVDQATEPQVELEQEAVEPAPKKSADELLAEEGLQVNLPPSQIVMLVGLKADGAPFFEVMGASANLITVSGVLDLAKRNVDNLWNRSLQNKAQS